MITLGDLILGDIVHFLWGSNDGDGASITRATDGTIKVYKGSSTSPIIDGITDTEDFAGLTGCHLCEIDTSVSGSGYEAGYDYNVVLEGAVIDGQIVNAPIAHFSIENRSSLLKATGVTEGGTWSLDKILKIMTAFAAGNWRDKPSNSSVKQLLDSEDGSTVILEVSLSASTPYKSVTVLI